MPIFKRNIQRSLDGQQIKNNQYSDSAGSQKVSEVGLSLGGIPTGTTVTLNATTVQVLPSMGRNLAVYNSTSLTGTVTLGTNNAVASLAPGAVDANNNVGIICTPNAWTYIACSNKQFVIASSSTLYVYLIDDESAITQESTR